MLPFLCGKHTHVSETWRPWLRSPGGNASKRRYNFRKAACQFLSTSIVNAATSATTDTVEAIMVLPLAMRQSKVIAPLACISAIPSQMDTSQSVVCSNLFVSKWAATPPALSALASARRCFASSSRSGDSSTGSPLVVTVSESSVESVSSDRSARLRSVLSVFHIRRSTVSQNSLDSIRKRLRGISTDLLTLLRQPSEEPHQSRCTKFDGLCNSDYERIVKAFLEVDDWEAAVQFLNEMNRIIGRNANAAQKLRNFAENDDIPNSEMHSEQQDQTLHANRNSLHSGEFFDELKQESDHESIKNNILHILLSYAARLGDVSLSNRIVSKLKFLVLDRHSFSLLLRCHVRSAHLDSTSVNDLLERMLLSQVRPDILAFNTLLQLYSRLSDLTSLHRVYASALHSLRPLPSTYCILLHAYSLAYQRHFIDYSQFLEKIRFVLSEMTRLNICMDDENLKWILFKNFFQTKLMEEKIAKDLQDICEDFGIQLNVKAFILKMTQKIIGETFKRTQHAQHAQGNDGAMHVTNVLMPVADAMESVLNFFSWLIRRTANASIPKQTVAPPIAKPLAQDQMLRTLMAANTRGATQMSWSASLMTALKSSTEDSHFDDAKDAEQLDFSSIYGLAPNSLDKRVVQAIEQFASLLPPLLEATATTLLITLRGQRSTHNVRRTHSASSGTASQGTLMEEAKDSATSEIQSLHWLLHRAHFLWSCLFLNSVTLSNLSTATIEHYLYLCSRFRDSMSVYAVSARLKECGIAFSRLLSLKCWKLIVFHCSVTLKDNSRTAKVVREFVDSYQLASAQEVRVCGFSLAAVLNWYDVLRRSFTGKIIIAPAALTELCELANLLSETKQIQLQYCEQVFLSQLQLRQSLPTKLNKHTAAFMSGALVQRIADAIERNDALTEEERKQITVDVARVVYSLRKLIRELATLPNISQHQQQSSNSGTSDTQDFHARESDGVTVSFTTLTSSHTEIEAVESAPLHNLHNGPGAIDIEDEDEYGHDRNTNERYHILGNSM